MTKKEKEYKFSGRIVRCTYNSPNFKIYAVDVDRTKYPEIKLNKYFNVSILGDLPELTEDVEYEIVAEEQTNKYGTSYKVNNIKRDIPTTPKNIFLFLTEILTYNQATVLFENYPDIIDRVREDRLDDIDLNKLKGIKEYTFNVIKNKIIENFHLADLVTEFQGYISLSIIKKIYDKYSSIERLKEKLKEDPYKCLCGISGVGFKKADSILLEIEKVSKQNINKGEKPIIEFENDLKTSPQRCLSCVLYLLEENENSGNTKMNLVDLRKLCLETVPDCIQHFTDVIKNENIYYNKDTLDIALTKTYNIEKYIAQEIIGNIDNENVWDWNTENYRIVNGFELSDEQTQILDLLCKHNICILNGSAGVGKSMSTQAIINMLKEHGKAFKLFSPTGKAAKVLAEYTHEYASTIHRGLGYNREKWQYDKDNKLKCDVVIIDEFSMVDIRLFSKVIDAIDFTETKLLLIGDNAQLPSVSCGNLLHDFMETNIIPTVTLTKVFRYGEGGLMKVASDARMCKPYLSNSMKSKATAFGSNKDYTFIDLASEVIPVNVVALYKKLMSKGYDIKDIQVLTAKNVGECGTVTLNNMIQKIANPNYGSEVNMQVGEVTYYEKDIVIQKENNYEAEIDIDSLSDEEQDYYNENEKSPTAFIANGESGIIKEIHKSYAIIDFDGIIVRYTKADMNMLNLGYSITIHKSQGSSIKNVILCTPQSHIFMLNSNLMYVGLTRMKEQCYHLGTLTSVNQAILKKANLTRYTFMQQLLIDGMKKAKNL